MVTSRPFGFAAATDPFRELRRLQAEIDRRIGGVPWPLLRGSRS
jgi:hypothetical protein